MLSPVFPQLPEKEPLDWKKKANLFHDYVLDPKNQVMEKIPSGHLHFHAFLEGTSYELITFGAIVVGLILRGEDVSALLPSLKDYYQEDIGIFMNGMHDTRSEYWYLMHVNALAAIITHQKLMNDESSVQRLRSSIDCLIQMARQIDYNFNDQGYDFVKHQPFTVKNAYRQPDAIGGYAFLMAFASEVFSDSVYQEEAEKALNKYLVFEENPWYEIPSQAMACQAAAKLVDVDVIGTEKLKKAVGLALDPSEGSLHLGSFGKCEINGLMRGWRGHTREEASSIAYSLESFILLPYLLPVARCDVSLARIIAEYSLHAAANARWFYSEFFALDDQGRPDLTDAVPYEALYREKNNKTPYAAGDFHGQKSIYGGAIVLWWGEIIKHAGDPYILCLDLCKTDFLNPVSRPAWLYYNPRANVCNVSLDVGNVPVNVKDLSTGEVFLRDVKEKVVFELPPREIKVLELEPVSE